jgi:hypothetical protein
MVVDTLPEAGQEVPNSSASLQTDRVATILCLLVEMGPERCYQDRHQFQNWIEPGAYFSPI